MERDLNEEKKSQSDGSSLYEHTQSEQALHKALSNENETFNDSSFSKTEQDSWNKMIIQADSKKVEPLSKHKFQSQSS